MGCIHNTKVVYFYSGQWWVFTPALTGADVIDLRDGTTSNIEADTLVLATTNTAQRWLADDLEGGGMEVHVIGDGAAPRLAVMAIYEGRELGLRL